MSEQAPAILTDPLTDLSSPRLALGATLRAARKRLGMEIDEAAHQLRMSPRQVLALEEDNFSALISPAFIRGFIRNYARLLKLDVEPLLEAYRAAQPAEGQHAAISLHSEHIAFSDGSKKAWMMYALGSLLVVVLGSGWLFYKDWSARQVVQAATEKTAKSQPAATPVASVAMPAPQVDAATAESASSPQPTMEPMPPATSVAPSAAVVAGGVAAPVAATAPATSAAVSGAAIRMMFAEQSWVSVVDGTGKEVFNKTKPAGTEDSVDGTPPFNVVIGNANGTKILYKGQPYDMTPYTKSNVARLKLE